jgi:ribosomal protein L37AE/L43A
MNSCPCCSHQLLRHIRCSNVYWFCSHCRQEMPNFEYSSNKARALSPQTRKSRPSIAIFEEKLPVKAIKVETAVAIKV